MLDRRFDLTKMGHVNRGGVLIDDLLALRMINSDDGDRPSPVPPASASDKSARPGSLLVIFLTVFVDLLGFGLVLPLLPIYADQYALDPSGLQLGALMASFSLMQFLFAPLWGSLSDRIGRRPVLMIGLAGSAMFYVLFAVATVEQSLFLVFVSRIGAGITGATIPTAQAYIADTTALQSRQRGMALIGLAFGLGFTLGPLIGYLAIPSGEGDPGALPGIVAASLSGGALLLAIFLLPESRHRDSASAARKLLDLQTLKSLRRNPALYGLLLTIFIYVMSFAAFETTLSLLIRGPSDLVETGAAPFHFSFKQVCGTFAFIGLVLAIVQGGIVRRLARRVPEAMMATSGALLEIAGFALIILAAMTRSTPVLYLSLIVIVGGFSCLQPSLQSLLSRRSDPERQGEILGIGQSVNAMARIIGSAAGIPMLKIWIVLPFFFSAGFMAVGALLIVSVVRGGADFGEGDSTTAPAPAPQPDPPA